MILLVFGYATDLFINLVKAEHPTIQTRSQEIDATDGVDLAKFNFSMAFSVETIGNKSHSFFKEAREDPDLVEWVVRINEEAKDGTLSSELVDFHPCTENEINSFFPIHKGQKFLLETKKKDLLCIDKKDRFGNDLNLTIYGSENLGIWRNLDIIYRPCVPR